MEKNYFKFKSNDKLIIYNCLDYIKRKNNVYRKKQNHFLKKINLLFYIIIKYELYLIILLTINSMFQVNSLKNLNFANEIKITVKGKGNQRIISSAFKLLLDNYDKRYYAYNIYINDALQNNIDTIVYDLQNEINDIKIIFNYKLLSCRAMFNSLKNIIKIDLSNFDSSKVTDMYGMFAYCYSLEYVNFNNFQTSRVTNMEGLFYECESLLYLDLSSFDTSLVTSMNSMFSYCYSLISLNINNFNTRTVTDMRYMFYYCISLISLNLYKFTISPNTNYYYMLNIYPNYHKNTIYCINDRNKYIFNSLDVKINCNNICFTNSNHKLIKNKNECINNCYSDNTYKFEYNNFCYPTCPSRTKNVNNNYYLCKNFTCEKYYDFEQKNCIEHIPEGYYLNDTYYKTIEKCNIKCKSCNYESSIKNLCLSCNIDYGFYPLLNKDFNNNQDVFINCLDWKPEGYFFENNSYKPCYETCKECNEAGDEYNNKCIKCKYQYTKLDDFENNTNCYFDCTYNYGYINYKGYRYYFYSYHYFDDNGKHHCSEIGECPETYNKLIKNKYKCVDNCTRDNIYKYEYKNICLSECPSYTVLSDENNFICKDTLNCEKYYNFEHTQCLGSIPDGYFLNDSLSRTIDKCHQDCKRCSKKEVENNTNCEVCANNTKYLDLGNCVSSCPFGFYKDENETKICKCSKNNKCLECSDDSIFYNKCISCNTDSGYFPKYEDYYKYNSSYNYQNYFDCYSNLEGYFLKNNYFYKCYSLCNECLDLGDETNHNCTKCINNYTFINDTTKKNNCYPICDNYYYFNELNDYICTENKNCPFYNYNKLIKEKNKCIDDCSKDDTYKYEYNNLCYLYCPEGTNSSSNNEFLCQNKAYIQSLDTSINITNISYNGSEYQCITKDFLANNCPNGHEIDKDNLINNIKNDLFNEDLEPYILNLINGDKEDIIIEEDGLIVQITSTDNQNNKSYINISTVNLGECENILKNNYNISRNISLIIIKIDYYNDNSSVPIIRYEVYNPETKSQLNLTYCNNTLINLNIPVSIDEDNIFKYDPTNDYYTDLCKSYTTQSGTDIILNDRHNEYNNNNIAICEKNCSFIGYEQDTKKAKCECEINIDQLSISNLSSQSDIFHYNFTSKSTSTNMATMKCAYTLFTKEGISSNIACYIFIFFVPFFIATGIFFHKCGFQFLEDKIKEINSLKEAKIRRIKYDKEINNNETIDINNNEEKTNKQIKQSRKDNKRKKSKKEKKKKLKTSRVTKLSNTYSKLSILKSSVNKGIIDIKKSNNEESGLSYNDYELNNLPYEDSLKCDKRTYIQVYISLIVYKHPIIFLFIQEKIIIQ